jgi:hypothetical protein
MTYTREDAARDAMYEELSRELYPGHKEQAIAEFTAARLQSYYLNHSWVMRPAVDSLQEGRKLQANGHSAAAVVFFVTAIELLLKATLLRPVVHGLVHSEGLAEVIVELALGPQAGFVRYTALLKKLFQGMVGLDIEGVSREGVTEALIEECKAQQDLRNKIIHRGAGATPEEAEAARAVSVAVYDLIVLPMLAHLGLKVAARGEIKVSG